jgi:hypothetical protein
MQKRWVAGSLQWGDEHGHYRGGSAVGSTVLQTVEEMDPGQWWVAAGWTVRTVHGTRARIARRVPKGRVPETRRRTRQKCNNGTWGHDSKEQLCQHGENIWHDFQEDHRDGDRNATGLDVVEVLVPSVPAAETGGTAPSTRCTLEPQWTFGKETNLLPVPRIETWLVSHPAHSLVATLTAVIQPIA